MKKWLALVGVILLVGVGLTFWRRPPGGQGKPGAGEARISAELQERLYSPYNTLTIAATDIHDFTRFEMEFGSFGKKGLRYIVEPDVNGQIKVYGHGITWASALDEFCEKNGCRWEVADPHTIRIRRAESAK